MTSKKSKDVYWFKRTKEELRADIANIKKSRTHVKQMNAGLTKRIANLEAKLKEAKADYKNNLGRLKAHDEMIQQLTAKLRKM